MSRQLKNWLNAYIAYTNHNETPQQYNFWSGISAIAGAMQRKTYFDQFYFQWTPNFYIILVGPSGITKSTAIDNALDLLREVDGIHFGPDTMSWQALIDDLRNAQESVVDENGEFGTQSCLTFASREWGSLVNFKDSQFITVLTDLWDGKTGSWRKATVTKDHSIVANPWINMIAGTTPSWLADNIPRHVIGGGFTSRCIFVWGDKKKQLVPYPRTRMLQSEDQSWFKNLQKDLIIDLQSIAEITGEYVLDKEAEEYGVKWYEDLHTNPPNHLLLGNFEGYLARKQGHVHKVAMVLAASYKNERVITRDDLRKAVLLTDSIEADMPKVFGHIRSDGAGIRTEEVLRVLQVYRKVTRQFLYRIVFTNLQMPVKEFDEIIDSAVRAGVIKTSANTMIELNQELENPVQTLDTGGESASQEADPSPEDVDF